MPKPDLHIITFAVPYPAQYGGAIDVWNRIVALNELGIKIELHCFVYDSFAPQPELKDVASAVHYYPRVVWPALFSRGEPYIVSSRRSQNLLKVVGADRQPVLFEGIHTTGFAPELKDRTLLLRAHNIEQQYYSTLAAKSNGLKSLLFKRESICLASYEPDIAKSMNAVFAISPTDQQYFSNHGGNSIFLAPFHGFKHIESQIGRGQFLLYQGDLSLEINQNALLDLISAIPRELAYPMVAAGRSGSRSFEQKLGGIPNLRREADVSQEKMIELIRQAQVILIHSLHESGMKLKIFPALYHGRFVAATANSKTNTILDKAIQFYDQESLGPLLRQLWPAEFTTEFVKERREILSQHPGDAEKAKEIIRYL